MTSDDTVGTRASQSRWVAAAVLLAVAIAGGAAGAVFDRAVLVPRNTPPRRSGPPSGFMRGDRGGVSPDSRRRFSDRMARDLNLTPDQQAKVDTIMRRQFEGMSRASEKVRPVIDSLTRAAQASMDSILTPEQRTKVTEMRTRGGASGRGGPSGSGRGGRSGPWHDSSGRDGPRRDSGSGPSGRGRP